jgi:hypothetical protein
LQLLLQENNYFFLKKKKKNKNKKESMRAAFNFKAVATPQQLRNAVLANIEQARTGLGAAKSLIEMDSVLTTLYNDNMPLQFLRLVSDNEGKSCCHDGWRSLLF